MPVNHTTHTIVVTNSANTQLCKTPFAVAVTVKKALKLEYTVPISHCSSFRLYIFVDGTFVRKSKWIGWIGAPPPFDEMPLKISVRMGNLSPGTHTIELMAEGRTGGCNNGKLVSWGGTLNIYT
jgi:hypothetical protein